MASLVYAPEVQIIIRTSKTSAGKGRIIDVSEDITTGSLTRVRNGVSSTEFVLLNQNRKYDGMFSPMDAVVVYLRRIRKVLKFSGYLDYSPLWAADPGSISLRASCTLKRLANFFWDPGSPAGAGLLDTPIANAPQLEDGGVAQVAVNVLTKVAQWPLGSIHISRIPSDWFSTVSSVADKLIAEAETLSMVSAAGGGAYIGGSNPTTSGSSTVQGIGPGTGVLPAQQGKCSSFGGPGGGAYGHFALTGESGTNPNDGWYCAMRWPYVAPNLRPLPNVNASEAKKWWANRRILVSNPKTGKAVVVRAADWGPNIDTGRVIDLAPTAIRALGAATDDTLNIAFAPEGSPLGPLATSGSKAGAGLGTILSGVKATTPTSAGAITSGWGAPGDEANMVDAHAGGLTFRVNRIAKTNFEGFVNDLVSQLGYQPKVIYGYVNKHIAGTDTISNHAYGAAIDIDPTINPRYGTAAGGKHAIPDAPAIVNLARKWGLGWGGEYKASKDYMHFEVLGAPASTAAAYKTNPGQSGPVVISKWVPPIKNPPGYTVTTHFGDTGPHWAHGHSGTDFACPIGTPIYPVGPGTVHDHGSGDPDYGNWVSIDHGNSVYTQYAHMRDPSPLPVGSPVNTKTVIGHVGMTGNTTGPHVHVELRKGSDSYTAALKSGGIDKYVLGGPNRLSPPAGTQAVDGQYDTTNATIGASGNDLTDIGQRLFDVWLAQNTVLPSDGGMLLGGYRALLNDTPVLSTVGELMGAGMREYSSAPNGDFIAWFPDYFGHYKQAGKMIVTPLEISRDEGPPTVGWNDQNLKTHQFVTSASIFGAGDADSIQRQITTAGIASVEFPELMMALFSVTRDEAVSMGTDYLDRFGARPNYTPLNNISGARSEFFFACHLFQENFAQQWETSINLTFMPEAYPGMLLCLPAYGIQGYVTQTVDSWDLRSGGFSSRVSAAPWSTIGKNTNAIAPLPVGAPL